MRKSSVSQTADQAVLAGLEKKLDRIQATLLGGNEGTPAVGAALVTLAKSQQVIHAKLDALMLALRAGAKE